MAVNCWRLHVLFYTVVFCRQISAGPNDCKYASFNVSDQPPISKTVRLVLSCGFVHLRDNLYITWPHIEGFDFSLQSWQAYEGEVVLLLTYLSDKPITDNYSITIIITNNNVTTEAKIGVRVMSLNDAPLFERMNYKVKEGELGEWLILVRDPDAWHQSHTNKAWGDITITPTDMPREFQIIKPNRTHFVLKLISPLDAHDPRWTKSKCPLLKEYRLSEKRRLPKLKFSLLAEDGGGLKAIGNVKIEIIERVPYCNPVLPTRIEHLQGCKPIADLFLCCRNTSLCHGCKLDFRCLGGYECRKVFQMYSRYHGGVIELKNNYVPRNEAKCNIAVENSDIVYTDPKIYEGKLIECPAEVDTFNYRWDSGFPGAYSQHNCPPGYSGNILRLCRTDGFYQPPFFKCTSEKLERLALKVNNERYHVSDILGELASASVANTPDKPLFAGDIETVTTIMTTVANRVKCDGRVNTEQMKNYIEVANNLMQDINRYTWKSMINKTGSGVNNVLSSIDTYVETAMSVNTSTYLQQTYAKSNFYISMDRMRNCKNFLTFPNRHSDNTPQWAKDTADYISLPCGKHDNYIACKRSKRRLYSNEWFNLFVPSVLYKKNAENEPKCSYWKTAHEVGYWSTDGCALTSYDADRGVVVCECNHLTNFAILMSPSTASSKHTKALSIISLIGCIISMLFLGITVVVYLFYWSEAGGDQATLLLNLCISLFLGYLLFVIGVDKVYNKVLCTFVAVLLHYLYLVVFFTMLANGVLLAKSVLKPFNKTPIANWGLLLSYVGAAIIVGISIGASQLEGYASSTFCWLTTSGGLLWAFIAPVLFVVMINTVIIITVLWHLYGTALVSHKSVREKAVIGLRNIGVLLPVLGVTWVFGVFSMNEETVVFQYLFCIFNSLQGLLIFIFHCILNKKIKDAFFHSFKKDLSVDTTSSDKKTQSTQIANTSTSLDISEEGQACMH